MNYLKLGHTIGVYCLFTLFCLSACGPAVKYPTSLISPQAHLYPEQEPFIPQVEYKIQPGDALDIKHFYNPEINESGVPVRPDGRISLQLVPEIKAAGMTPEELRKVLKREYERVSEFRDVEVTVIVRSITGQKIFVDGEVGGPGLYPLSGPMTVLQAIAQAHGTTRDARMNEIIVIRRGPDNKPIVATVDIERVIAGDNQVQDIILMPYDIVYVPRSPIANVNLWVNQYIRGMLPWLPPSPYPTVSPPTWSYGR